MAQGHSINLQEAATTTGNGDAFKVTGHTLVAFDVSVTVGSATVTFEGTGNSGTYVSIPATNIATGIAATTATASGIYRADVRGLSFVRARISAIGGGGVVSVKATAVDMPGPVGTSAVAGSGAETSGAIATTGVDRVMLYTFTSTGQVLPVLAPTSLGDANSLAYGTLGGSWLYNGATWDRQRNNTDVTLLASAARTGTPAKVDQTNYNARGIQVVIDVTAVTATPAITVTIQGKDAASGKYYTILASTAIATVTTTVLRVYPGGVVAANASANDVIPRTFAIDCVHGDADSATYTVGYSLIN
jgi:hypothetical protein